MNICRRARRATTKQKLTLLNYLDRNPKLAFDHSRDSYEQWEQLAMTLNSLGGSDKTGPQWKRYWIDLRRNTKRRSINVHRHNKNSTVRIIKPQAHDSPDRQQTLTEEEKRILRIGAPIKFSSNAPQTALINTKLNVRSNYSMRSIKTIESKSREKNDFTIAMESNRHMKDTNYVVRELSPDKDVNMIPNVIIKTEPELYVVDEDIVLKQETNETSLRDPPTPTLSNRDSLEGRGSELSCDNSMTPYERELLKLKREKLEMMKKYKYHKITAMNNMNKNLENIFNFVKEKLE